MVERLTKTERNNMRNHELLAFICETIKVREHMGDMACLTLIQSVLEAQRPELIAPLKPAEEEGEQLPPPPAVIHIAEEETKRE